jgi:hypothetical protein
VIPTERFRFALSLCVVAVLGASASAQQMLPPAATKILVVPKTDYEPRRPGDDSPTAPQNPADQQVIPASAQGMAPAIPYAPRPSPPTSEPWYQEQNWAPTNAFPVDLSAPPPPDVYQFWARAEYLSLRISAPPINAPLVTGGPAGTIGALDEPTTQILFGAGSGQTPKFGAFSGMRLTVGASFDDPTYFWEVSGFFTEQRSILFGAASAGGNAPVVSIPFFATQPFNGINPIGETSLSAGGAPSTANVALTSRMWSLEANQFMGILSTERAYWSAFVGFRYFDLAESLSLAYTVNDPAVVGAVIIRDDFNARNQYYAGQLGTRFSVALKNFRFDATALVGLGANNERIELNGLTSVNNGAFGLANGNTQGGVFVEPSNNGTRSLYHFAVLSELQLKVSYAITPRILPYVGYNVIYLSNVIRPGSLVDRNINPTQNAFFVPPGTLTGDAAPATPTFHDMSFWAHGVQLGLEVRF